MSNGGGETGGISSMPLPGGGAGATAPQTGMLPMGYPGGGGGQGIPPGMLQQLQGQSMQNIMLQAGGPGVPQQGMPPWMQPQAAPSPWSGGQGMQYPGMAQSMGAPRYVNPGAPAAPAQSGTAWVAQQRASQQAQQAQQLAAAQAQHARQAKPVVSAPPPRSRRPVAAPRREPKDYGDAEGGIISLVGRRKDK